MSHVRILRNGHVAVSNLSVKVHLTIDPYCCNSGVDSGRLIYGPSPLNSTEQHNIFLNSTGDNKLTSFYFKNRDRGHCCFLELTGDIGLFVNRQENFGK